MARLRTLMSLVLLVAVAFGAGFLSANRSASPKAEAQSPEAEEAFRPFWEAYDIVKSQFVDPVDDETLMVGALEGMLEALEDENTNYLEPAELSAWNESLNGEFEGIGATVRQDEETGGLIIVGPLPGSPAEEAGILPGDMIVEVGGKDITDLSQAEIINQVRGPAGTAVRLGILRDGEPDMIEITVIRERIVLPIVESQILDNNVGYIRLSQFTLESATELRDALIEMDANNLSGLVLDLRDNPGGYLDSSLEIIRLFVDEGVILIEQLPGEEERVFEANSTAVAPDVPLAVLVNAGSASASELVAGSFRDLDRAVIVGVTTFGKGTVQIINPLSNGGAVRVSIARWVTPDGNSVDETGLEPDVMIELDLEAPEGQDNQLEAAIRALKGIKREQLKALLWGYF
ncbi:MAG: S41 family peptidase [Anaerolineae bacterium]|nr:S41 family peptidase [Anaerolineae bacterium]